MEPTDTPVQALADGLLLLIVLALAVVAAVSPQAVILVGLPTLLAHWMWVSRRRHAS